MRNPSVPSVDELLALVDRARKQRVDPELALRAAADRFREEIGER